MAAPLQAAQLIITYYVALKYSKNSRSILPAKDQLAANNLCWFLLVFMVLLGSTP